MIDMMRGARPDEQFFLDVAPTLESVWTCGVIRRVRWGPHTWVSWSLGWFFGTNPKIRVFQVYHGKAKVDGTRTYMLWNGQLGDMPVGDMPEGVRHYVWTRTPKELLAARIHSVDRVPVWENMGGA